MILTWPWQLLSWLYTHAVNRPPSFWMATAALAMVALVAFGRLARFTAPASPALSESVRDVSRYLIFWPLAGAAVVVLCMWAALVGLAWYLGAQDPAWTEITSRATQMGIGALAGLFAAAPVYYLAIPFMETPSATLATPDAQVKPLRPFDPEPFFKIKTPP